jgi:transposase-like protein
MNGEERGEGEKRVECPFCHATDTEMIALFGMQMMTSQYYCNGCHSAFEAVKWDDHSQSNRLPKQRK